MFTIVFSLYSTTYPIQYYATILAISTPRVLHYGASFAVVLKVLLLDDGTDCMLAYYCSFVEKNEQFSSGRMASGDFQCMQTDRLR